MVIAHTGCAEQGGITDSLHTHRLLCHLTEEQVAPPCSLSPSFVLGVTAPSSLLASFGSSSHSALVLLPSTPQHPLLAALEQCSVRCVLPSSLGSVTRCSIVLTPGVVRLAALDQCSVRCVLPYSYASIVVGLAVRAGGVRIDAYTSAAIGNVASTRVADA